VLIEHRVVQPGRLGHHPSVAHPMRVERIYAAVGNNVRRARIKAGRTQEWLSGRVGLTRCSITNIEMGSQRVMLHVIERIAKALRVPWKRLFE
jgi:DNA-binding XRE family transcriptional regulator